MPNTHITTPSQTYIFLYLNHPNQGLRPSPMAYFPQVNGTLTLGDNIADNGGLSLTYHAYREWAKGQDEPLLPGLQKYTPQQIFWLNAANMWCSKESQELKEIIISSSKHSPNRFRVIGSFSNMKEFSDDFQCALGSNMNPVKKCQVW